MSLIQEALKRQQEEAAGGAEPPAKVENEPVIRLSPKTASAPPPPATAPDPSPEAETQADPEMDFVLPADAALQADPETDFVLPADAAPQADVGGLRLRSRAQEEARAAADAEESAASADAADAESVRIKPVARKSRQGNPVFHLLGVLILLLLLLAGGGWAVFYGLQLLQRESSPQARPDLVETTPASPSVPSLVEPLPREPPTEPPPPLPVPELADPDAVAAAPVDDPDMPGQPSPDDDTEAASTVMPAPSTPESATPTAPESVIWPYLQVTGVVGRGHSGSAMINGQIVDVGAQINGVRVLGLTGQTVQLEFQGEQRLVRVGRATE